MKRTVEGHGMDDEAQDFRFDFGKNWSSFLEVVGENHITIAEQSLQNMLDMKSLEGLSFLDVGCGSGLFSLAALRLGARVYSFDYDPAGVACTRELKRRYAPQQDNWRVESGDILDPAYLSGLGGFDIVYSWGVLHHTGNMYRALANVIVPLAPGGRLFIAIYNDQGLASKLWRIVKKTYNFLPAGLRFLVTIPVVIQLWTPRTIYDILRGKPFDKWKNYSKNRGMSAWHDCVDWAGGYPFEVARPEEIFSFYYSRGFELHRLKTCGGKLGCNEFVFQKK